MSLKDYKFVLYKFTLWKLFFSVVKNEKKDETSCIHYMLNVKFLNRVNLNV